MSDLDKHERNGDVEERQDDDIAMLKRHNDPSVSCFPRYAVRSYTIPTSRTDAEVMEAKSI